MIKEHTRTYDAHETTRMQQLHGATLASFKSRAAAFIVDFLLAFLLFASILMLTRRLAILLKFPVGDANLTFDFGHWYSLLFLVAYFALSTYWGNGRTIGKWLFGIRVVSLVNERMTLWHSIERALGYGASVLECGFGFFQFFVDPNRRTVHDRIAETIAIQHRKRDSGPLIQRRRAEGKLPPSA
jgi:uncharacterized RDD family membrane protein YckC